MRDIIGLDIDGVLWNTNYAIAEFLTAEFNITPDWGTIEQFKVEHMDFMTDVSSKALLEGIQSGEIFKRALPYNYAEHSVNKLRNEGFAIALITSRSKKLEALTVELLAKHNIYWDMLYLVDSSSEKHKLIKNLNVKAFVEDRFDILESIIQNYKPLDLGLYVVDHPYNRQFNNEYVVRVDDVSQAVDKMVAYRKWLWYFTHKCQGNIEKFIKEYQDGK